MKTDVDIPEPWFVGRYLLLVSGIAIWFVGVYGIVMRQFLVTDFPVRGLAEFCANSTFMFSGILLGMRTVLRGKPWASIEKLSAGFIAACLLGFVVALISGKT
jgi:hypothetical protein